MTKSARCHVCGTREPENPSVAHPLCHPCRVRVWRRKKLPTAVLRRLLDAKLAKMRDLVAEVRGIKAAMSGLESIATIHYPESVTRPSAAA